MARALIWFSVGLVAWLSVIAPSFGEDRPRLGNKQRTALFEEVAPAYRSGDPMRLLAALSPVVARLDDARLAAANSLLAEYEVPSIQQLLGDARLALIQQGQADRLPKPGPRELLISLEVLDGRVRQALHEQDRHPVMSDPLPQPAEFGQYDDLFWEIRTLDNRLVAARRIAEHCVTLSNQAKRLNRKSLGDGQQSVLATDFHDTVRDIDRRRRELKDRHTELRIYRLEDAEFILTESQDVRKRILAARAIDIDGNELKEYLKTARQRQEEFLREELRDKKLLASVEEAVKRSKESAGDLIEKSRLLYDGLEWWTRGRYGRGPLAWGLLKSPLAMRSPGLMKALYMPANIPRPTDPADKNYAPVPSVDRRHHYNWAVEYRPIFTMTQPGDVGFQSVSPAGVPKTFSYTTVM